MFPTFTITTSVDLSQYVAAKVGAIRIGFVHKIDELNAILQAKLMEAYSGGIVQNRTGKAARSVEMIPAADNGATISGQVQAGGGPAFYVRFLEEGTGPHDIIAKNVKALAFIMGGQQAFFRRVHHPGTKAYNIVGGTVDALRPQFETGLAMVPAEVLATP